MGYNCDTCDSRTSPKREEELRRFWWAFENDNFTLMYGQEMNALIDHKISTEEAERSVRQAQ